MLVFEERGKLQYPEKNLLEQAKGREPITDGNYEKCKILLQCIVQEITPTVQFVIFCYDFIFVVNEIQPDSYLPTLFDSLF